MKKAGFYVIKDKFFEDMNDPYLKGNKKARKVVAMLKRGVKFTPTQVDVNKIINKLLENS